MRLATAPMPRHLAGYMNNLSCLGNGAFFSGCSPTHMLCLVSLESPARILLADSVDLRKSVCIGFVPVSDISLLGPLLNFPA